MMQRSLPAPLYEEMKPWIAIYSQEGSLGVGVIAALHKQSSAANTAAEKSMEYQQNKINAAADQLGVHTILAAWFDKAFNLPPFAAS
jgi:hyaluronoglucosaminidase